MGILLTALGTLAVLVIPSAPQGYILDQAEILSPEAEQALTVQLETLDKETSTQMVVVTLADLQGYPIEQMALEIGRDWGVGQDEFDNGLVFLIAPNEREARIEVGRGLEGAITDLQAGEIIQFVAVPSFQGGDYETGILESVSSLEKLARGEPFDVSQISSGSNDFILNLLFFFFMFSWGFMSFLSTTKSWWLGGVFGGIGGLLASLAISAWYLPLIAICALFGLGVDYVLSTYFLNKLPMHMGGGGFYGGGRSGGGSSFGGFGGGGFGGGGASGRW